MGAGLLAGLVAAVLAASAVIWLSQPHAHAPRPPAAAAVRPNPRPQAKARSSPWPIAVIGQGLLTAVACSSPTLCVAGFSNGSVDSSQYPTGGTLGWAESIPAISNLGSLAAIACPSTALCLAVDTQGHLVWSRDPFSSTLGQRAAWSGTRIDPTAALTGIACPTTRLCVAVDRAGHVLTSTNPTGGPGAWALGHAPGLAAGENFTAVSCSGAHFCAAVAGGTGGALLATTHPAMGASS